jgi:hypothetical protein
MHPPPPYHMGPQSKPYDRNMADARSVVDSVRGILRFKKAQESTPNPTGKCHLLGLPAELRARIWQMIMQGGKYKSALDRDHNSPKTTKQSTPTYSTTGPKSSSAPASTRS